SPGAHAKEKPVVLLLAPELERPLRLEVALRKAGPCGSDHALQIKPVSQALSEGRGEQLDLAPVQGLHGLCLSCRIEACFDTLHLGHGSDGQPSRPCPLRWPESPASRPGPRARRLSPLRQVPCGFA